VGNENHVGEGGKKRGWAGLRRKANRKGGRGGPPMGREVEIKRVDKKKGGTQVGSFRRGGICERRKRLRGRPKQQWNRNDTTSNQRVLY